MEVYKILCRYYILHIASFGSLPCFLLSSFGATWRRNRMPLYHLNFEGDGGGGGCWGYGWFSLCKNFFPPNLWWWNFLLTCNGVTFFPALYAMKGIYFSAGIFFAGHLLTRNFSPSKSVCIIFFSEITHTPPPSKVKWSAHYRN